MCFPLGCEDLLETSFIRYSYDPVGNRMSETRPEGTMTYGYNAADQLTSAVGPAATTTFDHDANGNLTRAGADAFGYDMANRMISAEVDSSNVAYSYDGEGKRLSATTAGSPSRTIEYAWDRSFGLPQLAFESDGSGQVLRRYVHGNDLISMKSGTDTSYYHHDGIGSVVATTSDLGLPQRLYTYEPFGDTKTIATIDPGAPKNLMRFTGELFDADTGLYHLRARQYSPGVGRFTAMDPVAPMVNDPYVATYVYANNRPTASIDPSGMTAIGTEAEACSPRLSLTSSSPSVGQAIQHTVETECSPAHIYLYTIGIGMSAIVTWGASAAMIAALGMPTVAGAVVGVVAFSIFAVSVVLTRRFFMNRLMECLFMW